DRVIAASEDGTVYGLDATTGARQWSFQAEDGITSWPTLVDDTVIIGSDDRNVYGLDPASGEQRWSLPAEGPVEAPIVADHASGTVYVASSDGTLLAFKPAECAEECKTLWSVEPGGSLRTAPLLAGNLAVVIDEEGELIAVHQEDGKRAWALGGITYVGAPVLVGDAIVAASAKGQIERVSLDGQRLDEWQARSAANPADGDPAFTYGPVAGGDALWLGDSSAVLRRLGAPPLGEIPALRLAWVDQSTRPPFTASQLRNTIVEHRGEAIVVDATKGVFQIDPATGGGARLADLPGDGLLSQLDPVIVEDTLLTVTRQNLQALDLLTGQVRWQGIAPGNGVRPPTVANRTVLWATTADGTGSLLALDLDSGAMLWQANLGSVSQVGGVAAGADAAFTSTPPAAWDLNTGRQRWQAEFPGWTIGGPALSADGQTVYFAGVRADNTSGMVAAVRAVDGQVRWQVDVENALINPLDTLTVSDGLVVLPALQGKVVVLDAASGAERWRFEPPTDRLGGVTVARDRVWFMLENARLYGLDLQSGKPVARLTDLEMNLNGQGLTQRPTFIGDRLLFAAGLSLLAVDLPEDEP
ncbi:MAG: PQQ-binding-like beta-propeller repeat protein, partial [Chloroflexota bacterium]